MLSRFCHVQLFSIPWTVAHQAPLSMEFSREEYLDLPNPGIEPTSLTSSAFITSTTWEAPLITYCWTKSLGIWHDNPLKTADLMIHGIRINDPNTPGTCANSPLTMAMADTASWSQHLWIWLIIEALPNAKSWLEKGKQMPSWFYVFVHDWPLLCSL